MEELSNALENLNTSIGDDTSDVQGALNIISKHLKAEDADRKMSVEFLVKNGIVGMFSYILKSRDKYSETTVTSVADIIAELAKIDAGRKQCSEISLLEPVLDLLASDDSQLVLQACRALGNICYDNDTARCLVKEQNGIERVIHLLKNLLEKENLPENLRTVTSGCLLNLTDTYEEIQEQALQAGILDVLLQYLTKFSTDEDVVTHCLLVLGCLADSENGRARLLEKSVLSSLLSLFERPISEDIMDSLLELFGNLCESDSAKQQLAEMGLCEKLVLLLKKQQNAVSDGGDANPNIYKTIPDLVILILTGDTSMELIYQGGQGLVYKETLSWLKSTDENLHVAGALAAGNFARKDSHCIQMLSDGVVEELLSLLQKHAGKDGDIRMQHAVLSALRNLAIPAQNKPIMVKLGTVDKLVEMKAVETFPVVFKLLGTLRMLLDKQEDVAKTVGENVTFVQRLVEWCAIDDHPGVKGEATRLLAWLAKNSKSSSVMKTLVEGGALTYIISMMKSEHTVMQNEALIALTLIASCCQGELDEMLSRDDLISAINYILKNNANISEILQNALSFLIALTNSDKMKSTLNNPVLLSSLKTLKDHSSPEIREMSKNIILHLEKP